MSLRAADRVGGRGPRRSEVKERFWRRHVERQAMSGRTVRAYCQQHDLSEASFYGWRRELAHRGVRRVRSQPVEFVQLDVRPQPACAVASIEIVLSDTLRVRVPPGTPRDQVREVLAALDVVREGESRSC